MNRRWVCNDVWMDILPLFDHAQLGLELALISPRFNALVDTHFDGKNEFTIWRQIEIRKDKNAENPTISVRVGAGVFMQFPLPDRPLPSKICFNDLRIEYIDHSVVTFLRSNKKIFDKGTNLYLFVGSAKTYVQPIWDVFVPEILLPIFAQNIHCLDFASGDHLDVLLRFTSPTLLSDLNQLNSIDSGGLFPEAISEFNESSNATARQILSKWLHTPTKDGLPKQLYCRDQEMSGTIEWLNNDFKEAFLRATISSANYEIHFSFQTPPKSTIVPFELVNERTKEKLTLKQTSENEWDKWIIKRCQIGETAAIKSKNKNWNISNVTFGLYIDRFRIQKKKSEKGASSDNK